MFILLLYIAVVVGWLVGLCLHYVAVTSVMCWITFVGSIINLLFKLRDVTHSRRS